MIERYFDNAATTPTDPRVVEAMLPYLGEVWGNANSIHAVGKRAAAAVEEARANVAALLGAEDPGEVVFTSGATESNNWFLRAFERVGVSPFEHSSNLEPAKHFGHTILENDGLELYLPEGLDAVSLMLVNNEIGTILSGSERTTRFAWARLPTCGGPDGTVFHSDITQALGKIPVDGGTFDYASFSAHKMYGPKGVGGLYMREGRPIEPMLYGGEHEMGLRAGTLNVAAIVGFGKAAGICAESIEEDYAKAKELREIVIAELEVSDWRINGGENVSPYILSISFLGLEGETLVIEADRAGFAISSGAACSSRSTEPSHVLTALGLEPEWLRGTVRISFGRFNTKEAASELAKTLNRAVETVRKISD